MQDDRLLRIGPLEYAPADSSKTEIGKRAWNWRDVADWVDTEGGIYVSAKGGRYVIEVTQRGDRVPLDGLADFVRRHGISCKVYKDGPDYHADIMGAESVAKVVTKIRPYLRTEKRAKQIEYFKSVLARPRKATVPSIRRAREILGI